MPFITRVGAQFMHQNKRFRFVGVNAYPLIQNNLSVEILDRYFGYCQQDGITVVRTWCFNKTSPATNTVGNFRYLNATTLNWVESTFVSLDRVLDSARRHGIRLILPLVDEFGNGKVDYLRWNDAINGTSYATAKGWEFFNDSNIRQMYKDFVDKLASRVNTVNGIAYALDDTIFSWELGNELRHGESSGGGGEDDPDINTADSRNLAELGGPDGWADVMSTYIKSKFPRHMVGFGDLGHFWRYSSSGGDEDAVYNGSYYGVDYTVTGALPNIDYHDFHLYIYDAFESETNCAFRKYGIKLGFPGAGTANGLIGQLDEFIRLAKQTNNKPVIIGEWGVDKRNTFNDRFTSYPRSVHFDKLFNIFFTRDGDGVCLWSYKTSDILDDNNYNIKPNGVHQAPYANGNANDDNSSLRAVMRRWAYRISGRRIPA